jgi:Protein of unknown function (DUF3592)
MAKEKLRPLGKTNHLNRRLRWFCFFIFFGGIATIGIGGKTCYRAWLARDWVATPCTIESGTITSKRTAGQAPTYGFTVSYRYSYGGQDYSSVVGTLDPEAELDLKTAGAMSNRYPPDAKATCYVDPQQPTVAVLDRTVSSRDMAATAFGAVMVLGGLVGVMAVKRK